MKIFLQFCLIFLFLISTNYKVSSQCVAKLKSFAPGEKITYQAYYNLGFIWIHAGDVQFSVNQKNYGSRNAFLFEASGTSLKSYDWMYKVRDKFTSIVDIEKFNPLWFEQNTLEGGYSTHEYYTFNPKNNKVFASIENSKKAKTLDSVKTPSCTFDVLSAIYFCRTINFEQYKKNEKIPVSTLIDGKVYSLYLRYKGKENIKVHEGTDVYRCIKFSALVVEGTIFKGGEDMFIWVTDDDNRIPVLVEAKILIGSVKGYLNTAEGLRNASNAKIK